jgi:hypothetical protein
MHQLRMRAGSVTPPPAAPATPAAVDAARVAPGHASPSPAARAAAAAAARHASAPPPPPPPHRWPQAPVASSRYMAANATRRDRSRGRAAAFWQRPGGARGDLRPAKHSFRTSSFDNGQGN